MPWFSALEADIFSAPTIASNLYFSHKKQKLIIKIVTYKKVAYNAIVVTQLRPHVEFVERTEV